MNLEQKLSEMADVKFNEMAEKKFPLQRLADFSKITALQVAYMEGLKDAIELPEVKALVEALEKYGRASVYVPETDQNESVAHKALSTWKAFKENT